MEDKKEAPHPQQFGTNRALKDKQAKAAELAKPAKIELSNCKVNSCFKKWKTMQEQKI